MKNWIKEQAILFGKAFLIMAILPFLFVANLLGFQHCWQCHKVIHVCKSYKYWTWHDRKKPVRVCADCSYFLEEYDREGLE